MRHPVSALRAPLTLSRRVLLRLCGALALVAALPVRRGPARAAPLRAAALAALVPSPASAAIVGHEYLRVTPGEADLGTLCDRLWPADDQAAGDLAAALAARQRADFVEGRTVRLRGWILARTEARLCALVALSRTAIPVS